MHIAVHSVTSLLSSVHLAWMMNVQSSSTSRFEPRDIEALLESATISLDEFSIPNSLFVSGITVDFIGRPAAGGRFSDVFRGTYRGREVAVKRLCVRSRDGATTLYQRFCEEALTWKDLKHERILDFIGIDQDAFKSNGSLCMVSPWMVKGTLTEYLRNEGAAPINHKVIMMDIASGLQFLHTRSPPLAHGDLHGSNVLLNIDCRASLGDFGLTAVADQFSARREWAGAIRWLSPELLHLEGDPPPKTTSGDVFAFGRVCLSVFTRQIPFPEVLDPWALIPNIMKNVQPRRPTQNDCFGTVLSDRMWALISRCWDIDARARPHMNEICRILEGTTVDYFPPSLFISDISTRDNNAPVASGAFAEVFRGTYQGQDVAIKRFRIYLSDANENKKLHERFYREARIWAQLRHPRILPFLGIDEGALRDKRELRVISPWMARGTLMEHLNQAGDEPINHDILLTDILSGLHHLHSRSLTHGNLHGSNVYITDQGDAVLGDFGLTAIADLKSVTTTTNRTDAIRWMSPEFLFNNASKTMAGDIFSFGRICLTVYTRCAPFHEISQDFALAMKIINNEHPSKPGQDQCFGATFPDELWDLVIQCWSPDPATRPSVSHIVHKVDTISRMNIPSNLFIKGVIAVNQAPVGGGSFADVYRGEWNRQAVAIKRVRPSPFLKSDKLTKRFYRLATNWRQLRHPRVLTLLGIDQDALDATGSLSLVSPWMKNGSLMRYFQYSSSHAISHDHKLMIQDIASGLQYLHGEGYVYGDLHGSNVLVDDHGRLLLSGTMLTARDMVDSVDRIETTTINKAGAIRWMAPELLHTDDGPAPRKTMSGDIFAFGRLCLTIYTRRIPYHAISSDVGVLFRVINHEHPARPTEDECHGTAMPDSLWKMILRCWSLDPKARPIIDDIVSEVDEMAF